jgi:hypothetical protein
VTNVTVSAPRSAGLFNTCDLSHRSVFSTLIWLHYLLEEAEAMTVSEITGNTSVAEVVKRCPNARRIFDGTA